MQKISLEANVSARKPRVPIQGSGQEIHQSPHHLLLHSIFQKLSLWWSSVHISKRAGGSFSIMLVDCEDTKIILFISAWQVLLAIYSEQLRCLLLQETSATTLSSPLSLFHIWNKESLSTLVTEPATRKKANLPLHVHNQKGKELQGHRQTEKQGPLFLTRIDRPGAHDRHF